MRLDLEGLAGFAGTADFFHKYFLQKLPLHASTEFAQPVLSSKLILMFVS